MKQLVSILIPAFNAEKWIRDCIESALAQTWPFKEIIIVDDGSTDKTCAVASDYTSPNLILISQENRGASAARNRALSLAQGDYIQWLDADDILAPDKIAKQMEFGEAGQNSRILLSGVWGKFYHWQERSKFMPNSLWNDMEPVEWLLRKIDENLWMPPMTWLVSRKLTDMAGPWDESLSLDDDGEYFCRVLCNSEGVHFISEARCFKRATIGLSHDLTLNNNKLNSLSISLFSYIERLRLMEDSPRTRAACLKLLNRWVLYFYPERQDIYQRMILEAKELGGELSPPTLRKKYRWVQKIFGWKIAKMAQFVFPPLRSMMESKLERFWVGLKKEQMNLRDVPKQTKL